MTQCTSLKNLYSNYRQSSIALSILLGLTFLVMLILNHYTPLIADDYSYAFVFGAEETESLRALS